MEFPSEISFIIKQFSMPITNPNWRHKHPSHFYAFASSESFLRFNFSPIYKDLPFSKAWAIHNFFILWSDGRILLPNEGGPMKWFWHDDYIYAHGKRFNFYKTLW